jgi:hypothetical protein
MKVLEKLPLYEKIPHENYYLNILNVNQDVNNLRFLVFLIVQSYLMIFGDANLTVDSLVVRYHEDHCTKNKHMFQVLTRVLFLTCTENSFLF